MLLAPTWQILDDFEPEGTVVEQTGGSTGKPALVPSHIQRSPTNRVSDGVEHPAHDGINAHIGFGVFAGLARLG